MKKIISRFYLITIDNKPVYVGYTNRTVKQRFREHIKEKDLPEEAEVKQIDKLEFDFTWDINKVNDNANLVSKRESELILKYKTQDSVYQKGVSDKLGGQTWNSVKKFVHSNKDNPKYRGLSSQELLKYLDNFQKNITRLSNFVSNYQDPRKPKLNNFISNYRDMRIFKLGSFVDNYQDPRKHKLGNFIHHYQDPRLRSLSTFITAYKDPRKPKLADFIHNYQDPRKSKLSSFIHHYQDERVSMLNNFIKRYRY